jgi:hypothetical protein
METLNVLKRDIFKCGAAVLGALTMSAAGRIPTCCI